MSHKQLAKDLSLFEFMVSVEELRMSDRALEIQLLD